MSSLGVAIVGCGRISDLHALGYRNRQDAKIVAVCDKNRGLARQKGREWGASKIYTDFRSVLVDPAVDLVELLLPHHLHAPMAIAACEAGKHVSVQKPMALSVAECDQMIQAAERNNVQLRIFENFIFYPPFVRVKQMIQAGEIGTPRMIRLHMNTGTRDTGWDVPLRAWGWRFNHKKSGGGPLVFDHGYHLFSLARFLMGDVSRVFAWIDKTPVLPTLYLDGPAAIMFQFKDSPAFGVMDFVHTPEMRIDSDYYPDDNRVEIVGDRGILFINRCTARTIDLPAVMLFRDGKTTTIDVPRDEWHHSFVDSTQHLIDVLRDGGQPRLDGRDGRAVLQFALAAHESATTGREARPQDLRPMV